MFTTGPIAPTTYTAPPRGFRTFVAIWPAQSPPVIGSGMTGFVAECLSRRDDVTATRPEATARARFRTSRPIDVGRFGSIAGALLGGLILALRWDLRTLLLVSGAPAFGSAAIAFLSSLRTSAPSAMQVDPELATLQTARR